MPGRKEIDEIIDLVRKQGWVAEFTRRRGHWKLTSPGGIIVGTSGTPSDWRSILDFKSNLRPAGADLPTANPKKKHPKKATRSRNGECERCVLPTS